MGKTSRRRLERCNRTGFFGGTQESPVIREAEALIAEIEALEELKRMIANGSIPLGEVRE